MSRIQWLALWLGCVALSTLSQTVFATTCYTDCEARFPKWYQEPDRRRCQMEKNVACFDASRLPRAVDLSGFHSKADALSERLVRDFLEGGYVISRKPDGSAEHRGDSALWSAIAMATMDCDASQAIEDALVQSIHKNGGRWIRFEPLPANYQGNETSRDMETGAVFGFALRSIRCPASRPALKAAWKKHRDFVLGNDGKLHEGSNWNFRMTPGFKFAWDLVSWHFGLASKPDNSDVRLFETAMVAGAKAIAFRKDACYPIHLSTLLAVTAAKLGMPIIELAKREFCHDTRGLGLPLTEWFCGRADAAQFLAEFRTDQWEYRHQRCSAWESPDVDPGEGTPGVDFFAMWALAGGN
jgi:hypothetical protein